MYQSFRAIFLILFFANIWSCRNEKISQENGISETISFNKDIRPILNNKCISCHGGVRKKGGLSFLLEEEAFQKTDNGKYAIIKGNAAESELIKRINHADPQERMPKKGDPLNKNEIELFTKWINQGAKWETHWAFIAPDKPEIPAVKNKAWIHNTIDAFILNKLESVHLKPNDQAESRDLIRRVYLDITGLPPSTLVVTRLVEKLNDDEFEKLVDALLNSSTYGEKWASMWLDLARYADTRGYEKDDHRDMWKYRDWVIKAFNTDMSYDQFTIKQLAGDLLPDNLQENLIATAFHRNTMNNDEGGTDDEEFRTAAVIDRNNTTYEIWQGISMACVQCHSHPYDPILHAEYYQSYAILNNTEDADRDDQAPTLAVYQDLDQASIDSLKNFIAKFDSKKNKDQIKTLESKLAGIKSYSLPIMHELPLEKKRKSYLFERGNFMTHGAEVRPAVPSILSDIKDSAVLDRLAFAKWLVDKKNPLTARVMVNRIWAQLFEKGIVESLEDFGSQGDKPINQPLLDHLALKFSNEMQWSVKKLIRYIVLSSTYRQSTILNASHIKLDPKNYYLARAPKPRLTAEQIRDQSLYAADLLSPKMNGPSVMPLQPDGIWKSVYNDMQWKKSQGEDAYRRAVYTYLKRTSSYPSFIIFDSPTREFCLSRRINTNTPLQALVTLNDPVYLEAARHLGAYMQNQSGTIEEKISAGYSKAILHTISQASIKTLVNLFDQSSKNQSLKENPFTIVANAIMNLDQFISRS